MPRRSRYFQQGQIAPQHAQQGVVDHVFAKGQRQRFEGIAQLNETLAEGRLGKAVGEAQTETLPGVAEFHQTFQGRVVPLQSTGVQFGEAGQQGNNFQNVRRGNVETAAHIEALQVGYLAEDLRRFARDFAAILERQTFQVGHLRDELHGKLVRQSTTARQVQNGQVRSDLGLDHGTKGFLFNGAIVQGERTERQRRWWWRWFRHGRGGTAAAASLARSAGWRSCCCGGGVGFGGIDPGGQQDIDFPFFKKVDSKSGIIHATQFH